MMVMPTPTSTPAPTPTLSLSRLNIDFSPASSPINVIGLVYEVRQHTTPEKENRLHDPQREARLQHRARLVRIIR